MQKKCTFFVVLGNGGTLLGMPDIELLNILNINHNTIGTEKEEKGINCIMRTDGILSAGSEQCFVNTGLETSCVKTNSNTNCYTNSGSNSDLNKRLHNVFIPMINNNQIECSISDPNTVTKTNNCGNSNFNNRPDNTLLSNNTEIKYFLLAPSKESDKKMCLLV